MPILTVGGGPGRTIGSGLMRSITGTDPAAGTEFLETVPAGFQWRIVSIKATLVTGVAVPIRVLQLIMDGGAAPEFFASTSSSQAASFTRQSIWSPTGIPNFIVPTVNDVIISIAPQMILGPGFRFFSRTFALAAGDNWGAPTFLVEEWGL